MKRRDWALLALGESPDGKLAPVQMQKSMFLLGENTTVGQRLDFYHFEPYHYGPFDRNVYRDLDDLCDVGLVRRVKSGRESGGEDFQITEAGRTVAANYRPSDSELAYLRKIVRWLKPLSFSQLVSAIYRAYPSFREKSIFRG